MVYQRRKGDAMARWVSWRTLHEQPRHQIGPVVAVQREGEDHGLALVPRDIHPRSE